MKNSTSKMKGTITMGARTIDDAFGLCPVCHKTDGFANAGRSHRFYCKEHKKSWLVGSNLFSSWREQTEDEQRRIWNEIGLNDFDDVEPYFHPRKVGHVDSFNSTSTWTCCLSNE